MPDEPSAPNKSAITFEELARLKHKINQEIRWRGLNSREITEMKHISGDEWAAARKWYEELVKTYGYRVSLPWYVAAVGMALVAYSAVEWRWYAGTALALVMLRIVWKLGRSGGYKEGFFIGFENGFEGGIDKVLGIDAADGEDIGERAIEMEMDEITIRALDKKEQKGT